MDSKSKRSIFLNGIIKENPVLVLTLGMCPTLAVTTSLHSGIIICFNIFEFFHFFD